MKRAGGETGGDAMAFQKEVYKARPKRTADGAVNARYTHAKKKEDGEKPAKTSAKAAVREKATPAKAASSAGKTAEKPTADPNQALASDLIDA